MEGWKSSLLVAGAIFFTWLIIEFMAVGMGMPPVA